MVGEACAAGRGGSSSPSTRARARCRSKGWTEDTARDALDIGLAVARAGAGAVLYTDIGRDGMRTGPNLEATARLARRLDPCPVIASGGVSRLEDLDALIGTGAFAVVIGKALLRGRLHRRGGGRARGIRREA